MQPSPKKQDNQKNDSEASAAGGPPPGHGSAEYFLLLMGVVIPLPENKETVLGRDEDLCDVVLVDHRVSKRHATIFFRSGRFFISDLESLNGTFLNGHQLKQTAPLVADDEILIRPYKISFVGSDHPEVARTSRRVLVSNASRHSGHLAGSLEIFSVIDVIQLLNATRQNGILRITDSHRRGASLVFADGEIIAATYGKLAGEEAVIAVVPLHEGHFDFMPGPPPKTPIPIPKKTLTLLLEGCRRLDEERPAQESGRTEDEKLGPRTRRIVRISGRK